MQGGGSLRTRRAASSRVRAPFSYILLAWKTTTHACCVETFSRQGALIFIQPSVARRIIIRASTRYPEGHHNVNEFWRTGRTLLRSRSPNPWDTASPRAITPAQSSGVRAGDILPWIKTGCMEYSYPRFQESVRERLPKVVLATSALDAIAVVSSHCKTFRDE